ncbi:MAG: isoprenylcysteine carboxylmethyltransferase family protein [Terracidiphilus sp.]
MKISKIAAHCFEIWYASRVSIAAAAAFLAATSSRILNGGIDWRAVAVVALCAFAAYHSDDFVDFSRDLPRSPLSLFAGARFLKLVAAIASVAIVIAILRGRPARLAELLLFSGLLTLAFCYASSRIRDEVRRSQLWFGLRTVYLSLVWSLVAVLTPVLDQSGPLDRRVTGAILFIFALMLSVSALWTEGEHPDRWESQSTPKAYDRMILLGCAYASGLVIYGIARRIFPWQNLALLAACAINALFILFRRRFGQVDRRVINEALILMNILCCLLVLGAYAYPNDGFGPRSLMDWFQLEACALFFGNIAVKSAAMKVRDDDGDYLDLLVVLGLAIFGFQVLVACMHVERWLFPALHRVFFHDRAASAAGVLLTSIALILQSAAYISMSNSWRLMARSREHFRLITSGPFALTRNPIYVSSEIFMAGALLMNGTLVFALFLLIAPLVIHAQIRREEMFLSHLYAGSYSQYQSKTPRYILF